ncbi:MAG: nitronate monooxygenase [Thermoleophilaceae bacterium]|nr:nitronate monooxygenase [Thermoleophilaceae bacterium]
MSALLERLGVELPVVQAGMGGGLARHELAAAVSEAGGLGTIGILDPASLARELGAARALTARPVAVNLLLPFARPAHWRAARRADVVVTFWGRPVRRTPGCWIHTCGSVAEARLARASGADGVIVQGVEAGGHVRGTTPALELLARVRAELGRAYPVLVAGGIADAGDVTAALEGGADAAVLGTRFVMTGECAARSAYKQRLMESRETVLTELFGMGWPAAPHRVIWNEACERWLTRDPRGPVAVRLAQRALSPLLARTPQELQNRLAVGQRADVPFLGPLAPTRDGPANLLDAGALYAGESVARLHDVRPAGEVVRALVA